MANNVHIPPELDALAGLLTEYYAKENLARQNASYSLHQLKDIGGESTSQIFSICDRNAFNEIEGNLHSIKPEVIAEKISALRAITPSPQAKPFLDGYIQSFEILAEARKTNPADIMAQMKPFISTTEPTYVRVGSKIKMIGTAEGYADLLSSHANELASDRAVEFRAGTGNKAALEAVEAVSAKSIPGITGETVSPVGAKLAATQAAVETAAENAATKGEQAAAKLEQTAVNTERALVPVNSSLPKAEQAAEGIWAKFAKMSGGKKAAIIAVPVVVAVGLGYWALREKSKDKEQQQPSYPTRS